MTTQEILSLLSSREITCVEVVKSFLSRIEEVDNVINAFLEVFREESLEEAARIDSLISEGRDPGPLMGLPVALKDNICLKGAKCTAGSRMLENWVSPYDATVVERLRQKGAVFIGKTNMDEFAMGSSTENSFFGPTRNPWDLERVPGGSSGGSAAAVAAGMAPLALGSDTGGSIRQPASFCGVYGLKPTYGLVSRYGLIAFASSLDQIGPFGRSTFDCAMLLDAIAGYDPMDSTSARLPDKGVSYTAGLKSLRKGLRAGVPRELMSFGIESQVRDNFQRALETLSEMGVIIDEVSLPFLTYALDAYYVIATSEASSNLSRFDGVRYGFRANAENLDEMYTLTRAQGFGPEVRRRIMLGTFALSAGYYDAYYLRAAKVRTLIRQDFEKAFSSFDVLLSPTAPTTAFVIGEKKDDPIAMYMADVLTVPVNLAGLPALSIPCGFSTENLPIGIQVIGKPFDEWTILGVGHALEEALSDEIHEKMSLMQAGLGLEKEAEFL